MKKTISHHQKFFSWVQKHATAITVGVLMASLSCGYLVFSAVPTSTSIGNSIIVEDKLGVGTDSPAAKLDVVGDANISGSVQSRHAWTHTYTVSVGDTIPLEGPTGETLGDWAGIVVISDAHRDATSALYHVAYSDSGSYNSATWPEPWSYAAINELSFIYAGDTSPNKKYEMKIDDGPGARPYIEILSIQHGSWNNSPQIVRVAYYGTMW